MAACPPRVVEEKGPSKIRTKISPSNATVTSNDEENKPIKADDVETLRNVVCAETKDDDVSADNELLSTLSVGEFEGLLQEVSTTQFTNKNCATNNPLVKKLIDSKVIDPKCLENDLNVTNWSLKHWSSRSGGCKEGRRGFERKSRIESYGPSGSLDGGSGGGGSAASRTTQGGSLQNLHGKPEGKKSSLHKSGSLNTFPNASSYDSCEELEALKSLLAAKSEAVNSKTSTAAGQGKRNRASGGLTNYGTNTCCSAVTALVSSSGAVSNKAIGVNRTHCGESKDYRSCSSTTECSSLSPANTLNVMDQPQLNDGGSVDGTVCDDSLSCVAVVTKAGSEEPADEKEIEMMMEVDTSNDAGEIEKHHGKSELLTGYITSSSVANGKVYDLIQGRNTEITEVDARVAMPMTINSSKQYPRYDLTPNTADFSICPDDWRASKPNHSLQTLPLALMNGRPMEVGSDRSKRDGNRLSMTRYDDNGNPIHNMYSGEHYGTYNRGTSLISGVFSREPESGGGSVDIANRSRKKSKTNNKQKVIMSQQIDGYFGTMEVEDILQRINSTEGQEANKLRGSVVDGKCRKTGNKSKKIVTPKEIRRNNDNDIIRVNGTKDDSKYSGYEVSHNNEIYTKDGSRVMKKKTASAATDEGTSSGSHSPELDADDKGENPSQKDMQVTSHMGVDGDSNTDGIPGTNKPVQMEQEKVSENLVSSFVSDFYSATESQSVVEDSEFHEVKKKKKKKPRSMCSSRSEGGTSGNSYQRYRRYGGVEESDGGRNSSSASSWANLSSHRRGLYNSDDVRRKSTSSMPPSDHSSPDNSDVESVHSLPAGSTTLRPTINKMSSSSSCTPQASYADIAKMTSVTVDSSNNYKFSNLSPPIQPHQLHAQLNNENEGEKRREGWMMSNVTPLVPLESEESCNDDEEEYCTKESNDVDVKKVEETTPEEPSVSSTSSSVVREDSYDSLTLVNPGVEFVGGLELPEDTVEVTFGFEVNEQLLQMTDAELMALTPPIILGMVDEMDLPRTEPMIIGANVTYGFPSSDLGLNKQEVSVENQGLIISHVISSSPLPTNCEPPLTEELAQRLEGEVRSTRSVVANMEPIYTESPSVAHQNIVDYIGLAWLRVSEELERENKDQVSKRVRYFNEQ